MNHPFADFPGQVALRKLLRITHMMIKYKKSYKLLFLVLSQTYVSGRFARR